MATISPLVFFSAREIASSIAARSSSGKGILLLLPTPRGAAAAKAAAPTSKAAAKATTRETAAPASPATAPPGPRNDDRTAIPASRGARLRIAALRGGSLRAAPHDPDEPQEDSGPEYHHGPVHGRVLGVTRLCSLLNLSSVTRQYQRDVTHAVL